MRVFAYFKRVLFSDANSYVKLKSGYAVGDSGVVYRTRPGVGAKCWRKVRAVKNNRGYYRIKICENGEKSDHYIHHLVAENFLGPRPEGLEINHKDGDKANNHVSNLEYVTPSNNKKLAYCMGLLAKKLSIKQVREIRSLYPKIGAVKTANIFNVHRATIYRIASGKIWGGIA